MFVLQMTPTELQQMEYIRIQKCKMASMTTVCYNGKLNKQVIIGKISKFHMQALEACCLAMVCLSA